MTTITDALSTLADKNRALLGTAAQLGGDRALLAYQLRELLAAIVDGDLDEIRAQAQLAQGALDTIEGAR